ncbi:unnamed protein product [[Candida] boidinii]|uniref:Unnamed protein product n=1 Tax=Candida boidinii TaxID=5477 RepID=A0A9W6WL31_CANBO|nr:hypothetical protein B5S30_g5309 [[Candida] boidinii]OWB86851.1 hypothetical protein B5S33_g5570 [[Candida] boidinii]GME79936.1 unnamed protein product [[Candida] boidinii]GMF71942.1 unnamed protein product [[Candida] boidinii]GMG00217.1 unnamed protein product [[Candida] boidinii]
MAIEKRTFGSVSEAWETFDNWLIANWKEGYDALCPPATDEEIKSLEDKLNVTLPEQYKESLKCHNGQSNICGLIYGYEYLSTEKVYTQWKKRQSEDGDDGALIDLKSLPRDSTGVSTECFDLGWIPITSDGGGNHYCLDLAPDLSKNGKVGQIIKTLRDNADQELIAESFYHFFCKFVREVMVGDVVHSLDCGGLMSEKDMLEVYKSKTT